MSTTPGKVLIIDDDEATTQTFARVLRLEGHEVRTALDAESGLREVHIQAPDAIIVDLRMPLINGLGFLYRLRAEEQFHDTPVAVVTGDYSLDEAVVRELGDLGAELRFKPLWFEDLLDLTQQLLAADRADHPRSGPRAH